MAEPCPQVSTWRQGRPREEGPPRRGLRCRATLSCTGQARSPGACLTPLHVHYMLCDLAKSHNLSEPSFPHP